MSQDLEIGSDSSVAVATRDRSELSLLAHEGGREGKAAKYQETGPRLD